MSLEEKAAAVFNEHMILNKVDGSSAKLMAKMACTCKAFASNSDRLKIYKEAELLIGSMPEVKLHSHIAREKEHIYAHVDVQWISRAFKDPGVVTNVLFCMETVNPALCNSLTPDDVVLLARTPTARMKLLYETGVIEKATRGWLEKTFPEGFLEEMVNVGCHFSDFSETWKKSVFPGGVWHDAKTVPACRNQNWIVWNVLEYCEDEEDGEGSEAWDKKEAQADAILVLPPTWTLLVAR
jgi:hypothetical protein